MCAECALRAKGVAEAMGFALTIDVMPPGELLAMLEADARESGGSIPALRDTVADFTRPFLEQGEPEPPLLNKSGGSDVRPHDCNDDGCACGRDDEGERR